MSSFEEALKRHISQYGPMDIASFMGRVVSHYYSHAEPFGEQGDFTTAPEISQMFGEMIGAWVADYWIKLGQPDHFLLIELGPGRGTLMADLLRATKNVPGFHDAMKIMLVENSPSLTERQKEKLADYNAHWVDQLAYDSIRDKGVPVIVIGNEFFDALPIRQFQMTEKGWREKVVGLDGNEGFTFGLGPVAKADTENLPAGAKNGDIYEVSPIRQSMMGHIAALIKSCHGAALFIDYGYDESGPVKGDTLQAVKNHDYIDVLSHIGAADLTSHVDFHALREVSRDAGCSVFGLIGQGLFLQKLGISLRAQMLCKGADEKQTADIERAYRRLCGPEEMGELFKVMAVTHDAQIIPAGFE